MRIVAAADAVRLVHDGDTLVIGGSGGGHAVSESLIVALEERFVTTGHPRGITTYHPVGIGDEDSQGVSHLAHPGLIRRSITGIYVDSPLIGLPPVG